jgi:hypothetical protein
MKPNANGNESVFFPKESQDLPTSENELEGLAGSCKSSKPGCRRASDGTESSSNF